MKKYFWLLLFLFFSSRFFFLANYPYFFDSPEYLRLSLNQSFFQSLSLSHESVHPIFLFLTQLSQKIIPGNQAWSLSLVSASAGLVSFVAFYLLVKRIFNQKTALLSLIPLIFFPHLWLIQTNILHESLDQALFLTALLFFDFFLMKKNWFWIFSVFFLSLAITNFVGIIIWLPVFFGLVFLRSKKDKLKENLVKAFLVCLSSFVLAILFLFSLFSFTSIDPILRLKELFFDYGGGGLLSNWGFFDILRTLRNDFSILVNGYRSVSLLIILVSFFTMIKKRQWNFLIFFLSFLIPFLVTGKFWHGGLFARYSSLIAYSLALFLAFSFSRRVFWLLAFFLILFSLPTFHAYQKPPVFEVQKKIISEVNIENDSLFVFSEYQRPWAENNYPNALFVNGDDQDLKILEEKIEIAIEDKKLVFISQQAINFPYWQYDGQQIHIISKGDIQKAKLKSFLENKNLVLIAEDKNYPLLNIFQITN